MGDLMKTTIYAGDTEDLMLDSPEWYDYEDDLQLAAELGKSLLERNKVLEEALCEQQRINDEQSLEVEFLSKQVEALRDLNESRLKVYEQLENNSHEVEKKYKKLKSQCRHDKEHHLEVNVNSGTMCDIAVGNDDDVATPCVESGAGSGARFMVASRSMEMLYASCLISDKQVQTDRPARSGLARLHTLTTIREKSKSLGNVSGNLDEQDDTTTGNSAIKIIHEDCVSAPEPEYKQLFQEIYDTLQKSKENDVTQKTAKRSRKNRKRHNQRKKEVAWFARAL